ncbi:hypothetical protein HN587_01650 [Candidatus Woesearchaeota archaeon]|jgi:hypothetical protein|nr:hypothetical protein [Candidatus Woesearchaeota archaeon]
MVEFNPDGSLKLPGQVLKRKAEAEHRLKHTKCIKIIREIVNFDSPKKCVLRLIISDAISDNRFVEYIHNEFRKIANVPTKLVKQNEKEFEIEVGTDFKRCTDCKLLRHRYRQQMQGCIIEDKGNCTFSDFRKSFGYEDYFD